MPADKKKIFEESEPIEVITSREMKILFYWKAPSRVFKRRGREFWTTVGTMVFLFGVIFALIEEWLLILVMVSIVFLYYVFSSIPPEEVENRITNRGIRFIDKEYLWEYLDRFWITEKWGQKMLNLGLKFGLVKSIRIIINNEDEPQIEELLKKYLPEEPLPTSFVDQAVTWLSEKIPLDIS